MQAATAVANQKYFTESWDIDDLLRMEEKLPTTYATLPNRRAGPSAPDAVSYSKQWTDFKDTYMAKFFIHTNLMCLEAASRQTSTSTQPTDFRTRMIESFDLPGLLQNIKKMWRYRKNIWRAKQRTADPFHPRGHYQYALGAQAARGRCASAATTLPAAGPSATTTTSPGLTRTRRSP